MTLPDGTVIAPTGKAFDVEFGQTSKWDGDQLIVISAFWDAAVQSAADRPRPVTRVPPGARMLQSHEPVGEVSGVRQTAVRPPSTGMTAPVM